jgi:hypothetical protein
MIFEIMGRRIPPRAERARARKLLGLDAVSRRIAYGLLMHRATKPTLALLLFAALAWRSARLRQMRRSDGNRARPAA